MPKAKALTQPSWRDRGTCWATTKAGQPCGKPACRKPESSGIPYCARHMRVGDEAFKVVEHDTHPEIFGKILVARHEVPKNYRIIYWGALRRESEVKDKDAGSDHMISFCPNAYSDQSRGTIDPSSYEGAVAQYAATNGPGELISMTPEYGHFGDWGKKRTVCAGRTYRFVRNLPKGMQVTHDYGGGWMEDRGIKKLRVGTELYPTMRRGQGGGAQKKKAHKSDEGNKRKRAAPGAAKAKGKGKGKAAPKKNESVAARKSQPKKKRRKSASQKP